MLFMFIRADQKVLGLTRKPIYFPSLNERRLTTRIISSLAYLNNVETDILIEGVEDKFTQPTVAPSSMHQ